MTCADDQGNGLGHSGTYLLFFFLDCYVYLIPNKASLNPQSSVMNRFIDLNMAFSKTWQISKQIFMFIQVRPDNCDDVDACCFFLLFYILSYILLLLCLVVVHSVPLLSVLFYVLLNKLLP